MFLCLGLVLRRRRDRCDPVTVDGEGAVTPGVSLLTMKRTCRNLAVVRGRRRDAHRIEDLCATVDAEVVLHPQVPS